MIIFQKTLYSRLLEFQKILSLVANLKRKFPRDKIKSISEEIKIIDYFFLELFLKNLQQLYINIENFIIYL